MKIEDIRKIVMAFLLTVLLAGTNIPNAQAQIGKLFSTSNQLSSDFATQVFQDSNGFIWITTRNGLNAYDGYNFTVMKVGDEKELNSNYINCISQDAVNHILLGTNKGLLYYNGKKFSNIPLLDEHGNSTHAYITCIQKCKNKDVAIGTSGSGLFFIKHTGYTCQSARGYGDNLKSIRCMTEDSKGNLWIVNESYELYQLDKNGKLTGDFPGVNGLQVVDVKEGHKGEMYLATQDQGIYERANGSKTFTHLPGTILPFIHNIYVTRSNQLLIGCDGYGIAVYNPKTKVCKQNPFYCAQTDLTKSKVQSITEDRYGNIWFCLLQKGVFMQPQGFNDFGYIGHRLGNGNLIGANCVSSVYLDMRQNLWVGTDKDGLYKLSGNGKNLEGHCLPGFTILTICQDRQGRIWIGTWNNGIGYIDDRGGYHQITIPGLDKAPVFDIKCDKRGNLWLATQGAGLVCLPRQGAPILYKVKNNADKNERINSIPNDYLTKLDFSKDQRRIYVGTVIGTSCLDLEKNSWVSTFGGKNILNKGEFTHCVFVDSKDQIWSGSENGVYCHCLSNITHPRRITAKDGLNDNSIASITEDCRGNMWIGTVKGLSKLDTKTGSILRFYIENGIQSNEFSGGCVATSSDKRIILMGGTGGCSIFDATQIKQHPWRANVIISGLLVDNKHIIPGMKSGAYTIKDKWDYDNDEYNLSYEDNTFSLQLSTLTYSNVEQIVYAYSINGEEWHEIQPGLNEISFSHLPVGKYHFRIKAICNGYETPEKRFDITIHPAWYASTWARLTYLLIIIGLAFLYIKHRKRKEENRLVLQKHIHAEELGETKLKFFMNISHEIRTPLKLILTPLRSLMKEDKDGHRQGIYSIMQRNSERILHLINQMMDLRKIDMGLMVMHMSETDIVDFIQDEFELFRHESAERNIDMQYLHDCENLPVWIDRNNFDKVLMNVLSNALKFAPRGGKVLISLTHSSQNVYISIKDNGCGIPKDKLETIFQRFYQNPRDSKNCNEGVGIGLDLTRSLMQLHYGDIVARNNEDGVDKDFPHGSEFRLTLPLGCDHLKPEEILSDQESTDEEESQEADSDVDALGMNELLEDEHFIVPTSPKAFSNATDRDEASDLIERVTQIVNANLSNTELSIEMIAKELGLSRVQLYRKMKEQTNQTPHSFIRNVRLKQAAKLIAESDKSISDIMYSCGFTNAASFSTMFKSLYGYSPRKFLKEKRT